jgi:hypothetical protein
LKVTDLGEVFRAAGDRPVADAFYRVRESGSVGHLNPAGHRLAAEAVVRALAF